MLVLLNALQAGNRSGTGVYTARLVQHLPGLAQDIDIAVIWPRHIPRPRFDYPVRQAFLPRDGRSGLRRILYDQIGIRRECRRLRANLVHYPANVGNLFETPRAVLTVHDLSFLRNPAWFRWERAMYYRHAVKRSVRSAERIIADSYATAVDLQDMLGVPRDRIDVIPLGVDDAFQPVSPDEVAAVRHKYGLPPSFFLYYGTLEPRKNLPRLIEAWSAIAGECPQDLVIAGREGWQVGSIRKAAEGSAYASRIHFVGFIPREELPALIGTAHAFVWPSLWEGFGLPPLEAMACGVPVLTSNVSSMPEVMGDAALLVDPADVKTLATGMGRLAADDTLRVELKAKGLARAAQFTWERTAERTLAVYRKVLDM